MLIELGVGMIQTGSPEARSVDDSEAVSGRRHGIARYP